ncbi:MAG TPA: serine protease [Stellaceae bacterium]|nr:serine protease [Stellaceae bacterium]
MTAPSPLNFAFPRPFLRRRRQVREGRKERPRRRWRRLTSWAIGFWLAALFGAAAEERDPAVIACYDAEREIVTHTLPDLCRGEVISAEREAALAAARRLRIQSGVQETTADPVAGTRRLIGTGSGFYVGSGGELLTNAHVVDHCGLFTAASDDGDKLALHLVASDARQDLALLKADAPPPGIAAFSAAPGRSDGARLAVVGYPAYGLPTRLSTLSPARIDPIRLATASDRVEFRGEVRHGNSGSPLLDEAGNVLGVVHATIDTPKVFRATHTLVTDIGVAISWTAVMRFLAAHSVTPVIAAGPQRGLSLEEVHAKSRRFVVQIGCWQ